MPSNKIQDLLNELVKKPGITEVIINNLDNIYVEKDNEMIRLDVSLTQEDVDTFSKKVAAHNKKEFSTNYPILDGTLPDGSRVNLIHKDYTNSCHAVTIRKYLKSIKTFESSPGIFGLNQKWTDLLKMLVRARMNIVVAGGTSMGKTTFLNLLLQEFPSKDRVITIEDTRELDFSSNNVVRLEARPSYGENKGLSIRELLKNSLRMRPDRIIVGEVRAGEVFDLLQAMNTGHEGSMTSVHANSPSETLMRLENLYMLSGYDLPIKALRYQISSAVDFIIQLRRDKSGQRIVSQVTEVAHMEGDKILLQDIGVLKNGEFKFTGLVPSTFEALQKAGLARDFFKET
ncbi:MAG TPA: ATPase, T2SS/T4P/T4SS family [Bacteriovoracaceae bacterium]|nr:ATPase, T2SS/T4P/T4SS family [Bacteriovoracaceae bacterium]